MSFAEVMDELPRLTFEEQQLVIRRAVELDDPGLSDEDERLVERRFAAHHADPESSLARSDKNPFRARVKMSWRVVVRPEAADDTIDAADWDDF